MYLELKLPSIFPLYRQFALPLASALSRGIIRGLFVDFRSIQGYEQTSSYRTPSLIL